MGATQSHSVSESVLSNDKPTQVPLSNIRQVILALLAHCEVPYIVKPYDQFLHDRCVAICEERGYPIGSSSGSGSDSTHGSDRELSLLPFLETGVYYAATTYDYPDLPRRIYIALYTAFVTNLDDLHRRDPERVALFGMRLMRGERHGHPVLDGLADILNETETHFGRTAATLIIHDTLGFVTSLSIDYETQGLKRSQDALGFPLYLRLMSAIPTAYAMFIFPSDMPLVSYIQSIPEIREFISHVNDVTSFYKEEMRGEQDNYISVLSASQRLAKYEVLQKLAKDVAQTTDRIDKILKDDPAALQVWTVFKAGYFYYHTSNPRYKLDNLNLG
jgi:hypothetical protein